MRPRDAAKTYTRPHPSIHPAGRARSPRGESRNAGHRAPILSSRATRLGSGEESTARARAAPASNKAHGGEPPQTSRLQQRRDKRSASDACDNPSRRVFSGQSPARRQGALRRSAVWASDPRPVIHLPWLRCSPLLRHLQTATSSLVLGSVITIKLAPFGAGRVAGGGSGARTGSLLKLRRNW